MKKNIVLIGMMGAGKSSVGLTLKNLIPKYNFVDVDSYIEEQEQITIPEIFEKYTEIGFRRIEEEVIKELSIQENKIISVGGGAFESEINRNNLLKHSFVFYLYAPAKLLYDRIKETKNRPMLYCDNPIEKFMELYNKRYKNYKKADFIVDTTNLDIEQVAQEILRKINETCNNC